jgi:hypothetical protein
MIATTYPDYVVDCDDSWADEPEGYFADDPADNPIETDECLIPDEDSPDDESPEGVCVTRWW